MLGGRTDSQIQGDINELREISTAMGEERTRLSRKMDDADSFKEYRRLKCEVDSIPYSGLGDRVVNLHLERDGDEEPAISACASDMSPNRRTMHDPSLNNGDEYIQELKRRFTYTSGATSSHEPAREFSDITNRMIEAVVGGLTVGLALSPLFYVAIGGLNELSGLDVPIGYLFGASGLSSMLTAGCMGYRGCWSE